jgi:alginate O-acetyltransferase complex protein AlgI
MIFNSLGFLAFFGVVLLLHYLPFSWRTKKINLIIAGYLFYAAWNPPFVLLLIWSTFIDWTVARRLARTESPTARRGLILVSVITNLGLLGFFKYGGFLLQNTIALLSSAGIQFHPASWSIVLPIGISFYTFQTLSFTIDVYRRELDPGDSFVDFAFFVSFFPQLVAGPIVRAADFLPQTKTPRQATAQQLGWGLVLFVGGLVEKSILADSILAPLADLVFQNASAVGRVDAWIGTLAFAGQIFFDFAGYSTCAIGIALCLGFALPDNFRFPYAAIGFSDFWRRWHISLSTWLRDYLYIPLGGSRDGRWKTERNLMLTMLLGGLWHGAAWRFVIWGGLHGFYLGAERRLRRLGAHWSWPGTSLGRLGLGAVTFVLVCFTWVFFRAANMHDATAMLRAMIAGAPDHLSIEHAHPIVALGIVAGLVIGQWLLRDSTLEATWQRTPAWIRPVVVAGLLLALAFVPGDSRAFIYFQF